MTKNHRVAAAVEADGVIRIRRIQGCYACE
jgi:hypothetical protein